jgi:uncharacterized protein YutE (UPF0331/DUF86 family)
VSASGGANERRLPRGTAKRLRDLRLHWETLEWALSEIGDVFRRDIFVAAATSTDPAERTKVFAIERGFEVLVNTMNQLAQAALVDFGIRKPGEDFSANAAYRDLQNEGILSAERCDRLMELNRTRNELQHDYPIVRADRLYDAVSLLRAEFGPFMRNYSRWVKTRLAEQDDGETAPRQP